MMDNFILQKFRDEVAKKIERAERTRNIVSAFIFIIIITAFVYIVVKQISLAKYFFL